MPFKPGDAVHVMNLGTGVVREVRSHGRYVVELNRHSMVLAESLLTARVEGKRRKPPGAINESELASTSPRGKVPATIDLHGMTAAEAAAALDRFLNEALLAQLEEVRVIHGRSGGRLKLVVQQRLREIQAIREFRIDPANPGVTIVSL